MRYWNNCVSCGSECSFPTMAEFKAWWFEGERLCGECGGPQSEEPLPNPCPQCQNPLPPGQPEGKAHCPRCGYCESCRIG